MGRKRTESKVRLVQSQTDVLVPRGVKNYLERILEPEEDVVFFERPRRRQVAQRNQLFVVLTLSALVFLPAVSILFGTISFFTIIPQSEGFFMVGLFLFDLLLIAIWTGYYHTLTESYVVTTKSSPLSPFFFFSLLIVLDLVVLGKSAGVCWSCGQMALERISHTEKLTSKRKWKEGSRSSVSMTTGLFLQTLISFTNLSHSLFLLPQCLSSCQTCHILVDFEPDQPLQSP